MKEKYTSPEMNVIEFSTADIITTSDLENDFTSGTGKNETPITPQCLNLIS